ncbi:hypothetical protein V6N11_032763 [Hibiscus sabdariffa]|uniref:Uncharacterized protein n=1 Tax=Hibiscus sabdariffa TaxID=183260 RepID=A0ABR2T1K9_9ROSI
MDVYMKLSIGFFLSQMFLLLLTKEQSLFNPPSAFPPNFLFGTSSSAYQYEGAYLSDGKGLNIWDVYCHKPGNNIADGSNGDIAVDHYHKYLEDIDLMHSLGVNSYRFSISWARILPSIKPLVTLTHLEFPQELEDRYGSWLSLQSHDSVADMLAAERAQDFTINWFLEPIINGRYPLEMQNILGSILPEFSTAEKQKLNKGLDFIGVNHYSSYYVQDCMFSECEPGTGTSKTEGYWTQSSQKNGIPIGEPIEQDGNSFYPQGMEKIVTYLKQRYHNIPMIITENGYADTKSNSTTEELVHDAARVTYLAGHLNALSTAIRKGADVRGYLAWSLLDNFEWNNGYISRFGLLHVDYKTLKRTPKSSATWFIAMDVSLKLYIAVFLLQIFFLPPSISCELLTSRQGFHNLSVFPSDFLFGTASSAYQYEGAYLSDGKGLNNWDVYSHKPGNKIIDGSTAEIAVDHYHRYLEDIDLMHSLGVNSYRFSISWARILPKGRFGEINEAGIEFYNNLIDALLVKGIQPFVTLTHIDLPQELEDRYRSWLSPKSQADFAYFADICFKSFGDRVKYWVTFNEPDYQVELGYRTGKFPPSRCSRPYGNCSYGDSEVEPFIAAHNIILAHIAAVHIYRTKYQESQGGSIGIVLHCDWFEPISNSIADKLAAERAHAFTINWFLEPIIFGRYPPEMQNILGSALPEFSTTEKQRLNKGLDFIGINHYTGYYVQDCMFSACEPGPGTSKTEGFWAQSSQNNGIPIGEPTELVWLNVYPQGMEKIVTYLKEKYHNIPMIVTENGYGDKNTVDSTTEEPIQDVKRAEYMAAYLDALATAIRKGANVKGYFAWSLLDNFEWNSGFTVKFGLHHVDHKTLTRRPKLSATWYKVFLSEHSKVKDHHRHQQVEYGKTSHYYY